jgi:alpha/beta superfamily hydrolase
VPEGGKIVTTRVHIAVPGSDMTLEGRLGPAPVSAVVAPPHPLYGGHLSNPVVTALCDGLARRGIGALAFNWRGVGNSEGRPSGDAAVAVTDYEAALAHVKKLAVRPLSWLAAGYSFGAVAALAVAACDPSVREAVVVAPPVMMLPKHLSLAASHCRLTVIAASHDEFAPLEELHATFANIDGARIVTVPGADHFFSSGEVDLIAKAAACRE